MNSLIADLSEKQYNYNAKQIGVMLLDFSILQSEYLIIGLGSFVFI